MEKIESMLDTLDIKAGDTVLDVGTGTGILLPLLMRRTSPEKITAIDASEKMIEKAIEKFSNTAVKFIAADILEHSFNGKNFDHIICYSVFPHFEDKPAAIKKLSALLAPGGLLCVIHSSSREKINKTHTHIPSCGINADFLLPAQDYFPLLNRNGLMEENIIDNEEMFMLCGRKPPHAPL